MDPNATLDVMLTTLDMAAMDEAGRALMDWAGRGGFDPDFPAPWGVRYNVDGQFAGTFSAMTPAGDCGAYDSRNDAVRAVVWNMRNEQYARFAV